MKNFAFILLLGLAILVRSSTSTFTSSNDEPSYDYFASTECKSVPEEPLYNGGIFKNRAVDQIPINSSVFSLNNLKPDTIYTFSSWVKITGQKSALIQTSLVSGNLTLVNCTGTVLARSGCWTFLKGGFSLDSTIEQARIYFKNEDGLRMNVSISSASVQPFTIQQWEKNQQNIIDKERKRSTTLHVLSVDGKRLPDAKVIVEQVTRDFPFGTAISEFILRNPAYQKWFLERFNTAVFENELKWNFTEYEQGKVNYTVPDKMLDFLRTNQVTARGHNVLWEAEYMVPSWVKNLTSPEQLKSAVKSRIQSVMSKYEDEFVGWDVDNEMLPWDFYGPRLGPDASLDFYLAAQEASPRARLFMNEFNVMETCDARCAVDRYVARLRGLVAGGVRSLGIGLQAHFTEPNPALIRGTIDKLASFGFPIWMTEVDISSEFDPQTQAKYLEVVLREGFSHPSINGIMLWMALHPNGEGCYRMCLTDYDFNNLPSGDTVDKLLKEWKTEKIKGKTDKRGNFNFSGFLGDYELIVTYKNRTSRTRLSLGRGVETKHLNVYL
ncbi:Glycosyl hydrolase family 10 protein [Striga hermonthica]|uniref:Glycosyl hydrolase family 10 protein n=1 Tax=Striga hermonthica TaxID=68872 RepID=A0A9N7RE93_STRHE|nr:Glycosyl hydrolase family 10 protein [Striga hermonthica]